MGEEIERLVTVWDANFQKLDDKLSKIQRSHFKAASMIKKDADNLTRRLEDRYGAAGKALSNVFSDSRLATMQAGSSRLSVFGSALEPLGAAGFAAAAGVAALAVATQQTIAAMQFADEIDDAAQKLAIGTDALQEYRFAMTEVGGETTDADKAIESFNKTLGLAQSGLSPKAMKGFAALGFTPAQIDSFSSGEEALAEVARRIASLSKESEQAAVAEKLGLGPMLPLLREGADGMEALRQKAQDLGYVMDAELVEKGADANQEFETMAKVIDVQLKSAFVELSDEILTFTGYIAGALSKLNDFIARWEEGKARMNAAYGDRFVENMMGGDPWKAIPGAFNAIRTGRTANTAALGQGASFYAGMPSRDQLIGFARPPAADGRDDRLNSTRPSGGGSNGADREADQRRQREERFNDQMARIQEEIIRAESRQLLSIDDAAALDIDGLERERQAKLKDIIEAQAEYARSNGLKGLSEVEAGQLVEAQNYLAQQRKDVREWERRHDIAAYRLEVEEDAAQAAIDLLDIDAGMARTQAERSRIERDILVSTQAIARKREEARLAEDNNMSDPDREAALATFDRVSQGRLKLFDKAELDSMRDTFRDYGREVVQAIQDGRLGEYIGDQLKERLINMALDGVFDMFQGGGGGKSGGDLFSMVAKLFAGGRAGGGMIGAGQWAVTGERGPEAIRAMPGGGVQVLSNGALRGLSGGVEARSSGALHTTIKISLDGASGDEAVRRIAYQAAAEGSAAAYRQAVQSTRRGAPGLQQSQRRLGTV